MRLASRSAGRAPALARRAGGMAWHVVRDAARRFFADDCPTLAAAIAFYALISLIPVLFLVIALLGYMVGSSEETFAAVLRSVRDFIPHLSEDLSRNLASVVENRGTLSWFGLATLVVAAGLVFQAMEFALDRVFAVATPRGFWRSRLLQLCVVVALGIGLGFSFYVSVVFHAVRSDPGLLPFGHAALTGLARGLSLQYLTSVALLLCSLTAALKIFPHAPVTWRDAFVGACIGTALWDTARRVFLWYLANVAQFTVLYGSLGALVAVLVWIYLSAIIFLYAAECVVTVRDLRRARAG